MSAVLIGAGMGLVVAIIGAIAEGDPFTCPCSMCRGGGR